MRFSLPTALTALSFCTAVYAQTHSDCDPTKVTDCKPNTALGVSNYTIDFSRSRMTTDVWNVSAGAVTYSKNGDTAEFSVAAKRASTTARSRFYIFFGQVEVIMKAAGGQGIVSSIVLQSDDLDEIDWEWIGGNHTHVQTNYFGKGNNTLYDRGRWHPVSNPQEEYHNYTVDWSKEKMDFIIDGQVVRTIKYEEALGGRNFPQTPCDVRLGIWPGGDPANTQGTIEWSGGAVNYDDVPFTMNVKSVRVSDASRGTQYVWGDQSGSYQSIQIRNDTAPIKLDGENGQSYYQSAAQRWNKLSNGAKIAIISSVAAVLLIGIGVFAFCCVKQRKLGKHERLVEDAKFEQEKSELMAYRAEASRVRSEKLAMGISPLMGVAGASIVSGHPSPLPQQQSQQQYFPRQQQQQQYPTMPNMSRGFSSNSVSSAGSGRGYQRY